MGPEVRSDEDLLSAGDGATFELFYRRYADRMLGYFVRRTHDAELAADLTAETFAAALTSRRRPHPAHRMVVDRSGREPDHLRDHHGEHRAEPYARQRGARRGEGAPRRRPALLAIGGLAQRHSQPGHEVIGHGLLPSGGAGRRGRG